MTNMPDTAMVLAAGLGTRMRSLGDATPKPLIKVAGKPLIDYTLDRFASARIKRAIVNVHYLADQIEAHLSTRENPTITISDERDALLETGGGLKKALPHFGEAPIFCTNTDAIMVDGQHIEACQALTSMWDPSAMDALLLLAPIRQTSGYGGKGDFDQHENGQIELRKGDAAPFVFTGLQLISPALISEGPDGAFSTRVLWDLAGERGRLFGARYDGFWMHVGDPEGLDAAEKYLAQSRP